MLSRSVIVVVVFRWLFARGFPLNYSWCLFLFLVFFVFFSSLPSFSLIYVLAKYEVSVLVYLVYDTIHKANCSVL